MPRDIAAMSARTCCSACGRNTSPRRAAARTALGQEFSITLDVVEPMGMETMVFFTVEGTEVCGRVEPTAAKGSGETMQLRANLDHMHLIDPASGAII